MGEQPMTEGLRPAFLVRARMPLAVLGSLLLLAACQSGGSGEYSATGQVHSGATVAGAQPGSYIVAPGDTLYAIARNNNVTLDSLIAENAMSPPYVLQVGQVLSIPGRGGTAVAPSTAAAPVADEQIVGGTYTVQAGDTLFGIAKRAGMSAGDLAAYNGLQPPYNIQIGQELRLSPDTQAGAPLAEPIEGRPLEPENRDRVVALGDVEVVEVETIDDEIVDVETVDVETADVEEPNGAVEEMTVAEASDLQLAPADSSDRQQAGLQSPPSKPERAVSLPQPKSVPDANLPASSSSGPAKLPEPPPRSSKLFIWPVDGPVISGFGPKEGGLHNDGINIGAPRGTPVKAADNAVVAYVGRDLSALGNLILLRHSDGFVTAYAHNDQLLVKRGDIVRRGEVIGRVGTSGNVETPQLHFEVRKGSDPVNPMQYLVAQVSQLFGSAPTTPGSE